MKYIKQFGIILIFSFAGELLNYLIPLPIPASIYGIILLFFCLEVKLIPLDKVEEASIFMIEIMPLMFIPAAVGLMESWDIIKPAWMQYITVTVISTIGVMAVAGRITQAVIHRDARKKGDR